MKDMRLNRERPTRFRRVSQMARHRPLTVVAPPGAWRRADHAPEGLVERRLVTEPGLDRNVSKRHLASSQKLLGAIDPLMCEPAMRRGPEGRLERAGEMADGYPTFAR